MNACGIALSVHVYDRAVVRVVQVAELRAQAAQHASVRAFDSVNLIYQGQLLVDNEAFLATFITSGGVLVLMMSPTAVAQTVNHRWRRCKGTL
jgi:hypothetical protein